jgi:hypothetical protein
VRSSAHRGPGMRLAHDCAIALILASQELERDAQRAQQTAANTDTALERAMALAESGAAAAREWEGVAQRSERAGRRAEQRASRLETINRTLVSDVAAVMMCRDLRRRRTS